jgi:ubiquinone/menaquinone biosynthesis C-methylase UbiE
MEPKNTTDHSPFEWLKANLELKQSGSVEFIYDYMASQSNRGLPVIYTPFDGRNRTHFVDQAQILDFALVAGPGHVLDFGPGDGWPALRIAPIVEEVVGVDGSARRVEVCRANAQKLGIQNARFVHVPPGNPLPFADNTFDGITAASSIEQTPDPRATLKELYRILKPGGKIRISTEILDVYRGGYEQEVWLFGVTDERTHLIIFDRQPDEEVAHHYGLALNLAKGEVERVFARFDTEPNYDGLKPDVLAALVRHLIGAVTWTTHHPASKTLLR